MSKKLPVISGKKLISCLTVIGYQVVRQRDSHVRLEKSTEAGVHKITIPNHNPVAKGTLNDILTSISIWNQIAKEKLIDRL
ncbi:MAG: type II toxin-antitoxin system HicA family toxin [Deltaproteobacteria bacterium]|nr:MAG: type II toxin-antitoxin system HicA family toxin [Deltaproteobacteria bacterium]